MPSSSNHHLTLAIAVDLPEEECAFIHEREPRVKVVPTGHLARPRRYNSDWVGDPDFTRSESEERRYREILESADAVMGVPDDSPETLAALVRANPKLRWVHTMAAGGGAQVKAAKLSADELARVTFTTSAGVHGGTLAEFAIFGLLAGAQDLRRLERNQRAHAWPTIRVHPRHLDEMRVLVLGLGGIGKAVASRLKAFNAEVWGTSRSGRDVDNVDRIVPLSQLHGALGKVDAVVVTLPGTDETRHMLNRDAFAAMKKGTILANVGRGSVIDEESLLDALDNGTVDFAALDVVEREPLPDESPLWDHERVLISPHSAALSSQEGRRIAALVARNATALLDDEPLANVVDTLNFY
ncbi:D-2-hydroxyacid dehydrogenase [Dermabacter sp. p3-SID358]|uniref:D-2-hydroxyacid dehydrogenase n=1 Tax=Dermabacter sp. p3-SID358 TaxID=2916114 RepID=UPI0021A714D4|nr:D-2-hydroxyacid dehydrogenase [Dermabacter sp. p3-SID358]MCT1866673.1 D-2-hydroxyacid dehydrogenase [Dermabacter sp. p3-SID358]